MEACFSVNVDGVFHCCRAVIGRMREQKYGRIVNIASVAGKEGNPNMTAYSASKAAVIGFTKSLAKEVATEGICVNAVSPAVVRTRILEQLTEQQVSYMTEKIPMRRTGQPEEIAAVVHFLASRDCSFVTGQTYDASGGRCPIKRCNKSHSYLTFAEPERDRRISNPDWVAALGSCCPRSADIVVDNRHSDRPRRCYSRLDPSASPVQPART